jgi:DNA polymerase zeta
MHLDGAYYISRVLIPPLSRIFNLVGADVRGWYEEMPKTIKADQPEPTSLSPTKDAIKLNRIKIDEHFQNSRCLNCGALTSDSESREGVRTMGC